jgi:hypothetical protein
VSISTFKPVNDFHETLYECFAVGELSTIAVLFNFPQSDKNMADTQACVLSKQISTTFKFSNCTWQDLGKMCSLL